MDAGWLGTSAWIAAVLAVAVTSSDSDHDQPCSVAVPDWARREFGEFFRRTWRAALFRASSLVPRDEAEDVIHDAYALALVRWAGLLHRLGPVQREAWIKTTVTYIAHERWRRARTCEKYLPALYEPGVDQFPDPADVALASTVAQVCLKVIAEMPYELRVVSLLCWVDGLRPTEIAELLTLPAGTVRRKLKSARDHMFSLVGTELPFEPKYGSRKEGEV